MRQGSKWSFNARSLALPLVLVAALAAIRPAVLEAQPACAYSGPPAVNTGVQVGKYVTSSLTMCSVTLSNAAMCQVLPQAMWGGCSPGMSCIALFAVAAPAATAPESCGFQCGGGACSVTIDGPNDALPVELMEFDVEGGPAESAVAPHDSRTRESDEDGE